jgi:hypothetical protein
MVKRWNAERRVLAAVVSFFQAEPVRQIYESAETVCEEIPAR